MSIRLFRADMAARSSYLLDRAWAAIRWQASDCVDRRAQRPHVVASDARRGRYEPAVPGQTSLKPLRAAGRQGLAILSPKCRRAPNACCTNIFAYRPGPLE